jgi:hypothetical protein
LAIYRTRFLRARSSNSASGARRADLICWTHFCSSHISTAPAKLRSAWITFFLLHEVFQWTHFSSFLLPCSQRAPGPALFLRADPVFLIPFRATPLVPILRLCVRRPHGHIGVLRWTHFYSFRLIDEEPFLQDFVPGRPTGYEILKFRKHCKRADSCFGWSGQHRDPVGAQVPRNRDPSDKWRTCSGSKLIRRAQVASAATGSSASRVFPRSRGVPCSGPLPSIALMPSAITKWIGTVAQISRMLS